MKNQPRIIAIDGPAASGKSSVARALARKLELVYVNSGAMYRAFTWYVLEKQINPQNTPAVLNLLRTMSFQSGLNGHESTILIDGVNPEPYLSDTAVNQNVSTIASIPEVRSYLVAKQRDFKMDLVMEGRDIGSVVFPETRWKFYVDASPEVRAARRAHQGIHDEIIKRDQRDSSRANSPLIMANNAYFIDSSDLTIDEVVEIIVAKIQSSSAN